jgi:hypothetical protein
MAKKQGAQKPRIRIEPKRAYTDGKAAAELMEAYAFTLDPWQQMVIECWLGRDKDGALTAISCGLSVPRQNGKNAIVEAFEWTLLLNVPQTHILHTAHQQRTSKRAFRRLAALFEDRRHPELQEQVKAIRRTNGEEMIELYSGNTIEYSARSRSAARGFDAITAVVYDEAQELQEEQVEALMSTLAASPTGDRQIIYTGTPPSPNSPGDVFRRRRQAALDAPSARTAWHEWSVEDIPEADDYKSIRKHVFKTNPAMGRRLSDEFTEEEFATMDAGGFARERLGWWDKVTGVQSALPVEAWDMLATDAAPDMDGTVCYAVKFTPDGSLATLAAAVVTEGRKPYVNVIERRAMGKGVRKLADWLLERDGNATVVIDGMSRSQALIDRLIEGGYTPDIIAPRSTQVAEACAGLLDHVESGNLEHYGQPDVRRAVAGCSKRNIGASGGFGFEGDGFDMLEAVALALWACETAARKPRRELMMAW